MATIVDYDYVQEISTLDALHNLTSDVTTGYDPEIPGVNTFKINAETSTYNFPEGSGIAGWSTDVSWTSSAYNRISWSSGYIYLPGGDSLYVASGSATLSAVTYIYYDQTDDNVYYTTSAESSVGDNKILLCVAAPTESGKSCAFQAFGTNAQSTFITADNIAANTIATNQLIGNTITGRTIQTASSGERFVMSSSQVAQYDSNGRKRVEYEGSGISFYDTSGYVSASIYGSNGEIIIDSALSASFIDSYSTTTTNLSADDVSISDSLTVNGWSDFNGDLDCSGTAKFTGKLKIPVGTNLY